MFATYERFEIEMTKDQAHIGYHSGDCEDGVNFLLSLPEIKRQLAKISNADLVNVLKPFGAWDNKELKDHKANEQRIIWLAAGDIIDNQK